MTQTAHDDVAGRGGHTPGGAGPEEEATAPFDAMIAFQQGEGTVTLADWWREAERASRASRAIATWAATSLLATQRHQADVALAFEAARDAGNDVSQELQDWSWLEATRGKRLLILGGDGRQERIPEIAAAFALADVTWDALPKHAPRALAASIDRIKAGRYDLVVCLQRFVSHDITDAVWDLDASCATRVLATSYGIGQLQRGFERFLPQP